MVVTNAKRQVSTTTNTYGTRGYDAAKVRRLPAEDQGGRRLATRRDVTRGKKSDGKAGVEGMLPWRLRELYGCRYGVALHGVKRAGDDQPRFPSQGVSTAGSGPVRRPWFGAICDLFMPPPVYVLYMHA